MLRKFGRSKIRMYVKSCLPSNLKQQLIYLIIHLVIALSNKNSTFPRRHLEKIISILFKCVPIAATHHGCAIENESELKNTVVSRLLDSTGIS